MKKEIQTEKIEDEVEINRKEGLKRRYKQKRRKKKDI